MDTDAGVARPRLCVGVSGLSRQQLVEEPMGMSFMLLLILGGAVILVMGIVGGVVAMALSRSSKERDQDDRR